MGVVYVRKAPLYRGDVLNYGLVRIASRRGKRSILLL